MTPPSQREQPYNVYLASVSVASLDSFEGIPEISERVAGDEAVLRHPWQRRLHRVLDRLGELAPGLLLAGIVALLASLLARGIGTLFYGLERSPVSPVLVTVVLGLALRNTIGLPACFRVGLTWCVKVVLRVGVALLGLRLSLLAVGQIGLRALPLVVACIAVALVGVLWLGRRAGLSRAMSSLIAVGTSVCGVSAIVASGPGVEADDEEVSYAVAIITVYGMLGLLLYPFLAHWIFGGDPAMAGYFLGTAIHDTSQVAGAGLLYQSAYGSPETLEVAATTKLVRNLFMGALIPLLAVLHRRQAKLRSAAAARLPLRQVVPGFVVAFVALAAFRSLGDLGPKAWGILGPETWEALLGIGHSTSLLCLTLAMAAIGLGTSTAQFRHLGWRPFLIGLAAALLVGTTSCAFLLLFA